MEITSEFTFTDVLVLESLKPGELRTGEKLYEDLLVPLSRELGLHRPEYLWLSSISEFRARLQNLENEAKGGRIPILVLELHGSEHGIEFANGERLSWTELSEFIRPINVATKNNLLIYANYCHGYKTIFSIDILRDSAPFWGLYGPDLIIKASQAEYNKVFFKELLTSRKIERAVIAVQSLLPKVFVFTTAESLLFRIYVNYIQTSCKGKKQAERVNGLIRDNAKLTKNKSKFKQKQEMIRYIQRHESFDKYKEQFLLINQFPEIAGRFKINKEQVIRLANAR